MFASQVQDANRVLLDVPRLTSRDIFFSIGSVKLDGFGVWLDQTVITKFGTVMTKFPDEKHFGSWLGLALKLEISGGKVLKNKTLKTKNRAGQALGMAPQSVKKSDGVFGVMYKRFRSRQGPAQATVSIAHALARVVYRMLKYQVEYETINVNEYESSGD